MSKYSLYPLNQIEDEKKVHLKESSANKNEAESEKKDLFTVLYPKKIFSSLYKRKLTKKIILKNIKLDNIRLRIIRGFFNKYLITLFHKILLKNKSHLFFEKFPQKFLMKVIKRSNKEIVNMTLEEIIVKEMGLINMHYNYILMKNSYIKELKEVLNKKISDLFQEYLDSNEFNAEINRLKNSVDNKYIKQYKYLAEKFIESFHV